MTTNPVPWLEYVLETAKPMAPAGSVVRSHLYHGPLLVVSNGRTEKGVPFHMVALPNGQPRLLYAVEVTEVVSRPVPQLRIAA